MNILQVLPTYFPATYWGGPAYSVYGLCNALAKEPGLRIRVLTSDSAGPELSDSVPVESFPMSYGDYDVYFCRRLWGHSFAPGQLLRLWPMIRWADVVQLTAVYSPPTIPTLLICRLLGKPVVWSPIGALQRWEGATKPGLKAAWERLCNALITPETCVLHVTSAEEGVESGRRLPRASSVLIPNGVDFPSSLPSREWRPGGRLRLLFIGRLHQKKGIENLLRALRSSPPHVTLTLCGAGDESYVAGLKSLAASLGLAERAVFRGHVEGEAKRDAFMAADVCVVPSFTENFGMVVVEALSHGVPVIASTGTPWAEVGPRGCGLWADNGPEALAAAIAEAGGRNLREMGERGRNWMRDDFSWDVVARRMTAVYGELAARRAAPAESHG